MDANQAREWYELTVNKMRKELNDNEREMILHLLVSEFCIGCGRDLFDPKTGRYFVCHCQNDD
jgi:hypothetical protein